MNSIFTYIKGLAEGWKIFFGLVGMVSIIATVAVKIDHVKNKKVNYDNRIDKWIKYDSLEHVESGTFRIEIRNSFKNLSDSIRIANQNMRGFAKSQGNLKNYMMNKAATKDDVLEVIKIWDNEKKNKGGDLFPIVLRQND